jgi:hypothetical protein
MEELPVVPEATLEPTVTPNISDEQVIRAALADHFGVNGDSFSHFEIKENTGVYARGGVDNGYFLMVKVDGQWAFVDGGHAVPDCNAVAQYGFPTAMVPECNSPIGSPAGTDADAIRAALGAHLGKDGNTLIVVV